MAEKTEVAAQRMPAPVPQRAGTQRVLPSGNAPLNALEAEIAEIRNEAVRTINALERRLSPSRLMAEIGDRARQATLRRARKMAEQTSERTRRWSAEIFEAVKRHPLSTSVIAGGIGLLIASSVRRKGGLQEEAIEEDFYERRKTVGTDPTGTYGVGFIERRRPAAAGVGRGFHERRKAVGTDATGTYGLGFIERRRRGIGGIDRTVGGEEISGEMKEGAREKAAEAGEAASARAVQAKERLRERMRGAGDSAAIYARQARERVGRRSRSTLEMVKRNPLAAAGIVLGVGAAVGLILTESRLENEKLRHMGDRVLERTKAIGKEQMRKLKAGSGAALRGVRRGAEETMGREPAERKSAEDEIREKLSPFP